MYWWVNQNQTWRHEIGGGYLWSPKRSRGRRPEGKFNQFYENMRLVKAGDIVFSYFGQKIPFIGLILGPAISSAKPADFGQAGAYWSNEGWLVPVEWTPVEVPFKPKESIREIERFLPKKYSPLGSTGDGRENVYLAAVHAGMAEVLLSRSRIDINSREFSVTDLKSDEGLERLDDILETQIKNDTNIDETERKSIVSARRGQGRYRRNLESIERACRVTRVSDPRMLRASHMKPWRSCADNRERLDGFNGLLLSPNVDHLFDRGYMSFEDSGDILVSPKVDLAQVALLGINLPLNVGAFSREQVVYLQHHRDHVYRR